MPHKQHKPEAFLNGNEFVTTVGISMYSEFVTTVGVSEV